MNNYGNCACNWDPSHITDQHTNRLNHDSYVCVCFFLEHFNSFWFCFVISLRTWKQHCFFVHLIYSCTRWKQNDRLIIMNMKSNWFRLMIAWQKQKHSFVQWFCGIYHLIESSGFSKRRLIRLICICHLINSWISQLKNVTLTHISCIYESNEGQTPNDRMILYASIDLTFQSNWIYQWKFFFVAVIWIFMHAPNDNIAHNFLLSSDCVCVYRFWH